MMQPWLTQDLPPDLWPEILSKLPVKSLHRFLSVSKTWRSIIEDTKFAKSYKHRPESQIYVLDSQSGVNIECGVRSSKTFKPNSDHEVFRIEEEEEEETDLYEILHRKWRVIGCIDGLFLLSRRRRRRQQDTVVLWNPSIRRFRVLPCPQDSVSLGLGFDPSVQDYKHVRFLVDRVGLLSYSLQSVLVYSSETNSWKSKRFESPTQWSFYRNLYHESIAESVCFRGALYFLAWDGYNNYNNRSHVVVSFDLRNEEFSWVKAPIKVEDWRPIYYSKRLVKGSDSFGLVEIRWHQGTIWWAHGEGCDVTWSKRYTFACSSGGHVRDVLWVDDVEEQVLLHMGDHVRWYNLKSHKYEIVFERRMIYHKLRVFPYVESLVLLGYEGVRCGRWHTNVEQVLDS